MLGSSYVLKESGKPLNCPDGSRLSAETAAGLQVVVLGNPIGEVVRLEIRGAEGQRVQLQLVDGQGRRVNEQQIVQAAEVERPSLSTRHAAPGLLLLQVRSGSQNVTLKLLKP
ncbi:T9SS type A sorting domain-containing protein [Larkinella bovis]|uniref:T9SS type A sorting domain-containing protein n=1 Tax=Larkinella bovis TaxID=683041 RepID=A0ABW0IBT2_9BACT